MAADGSGMILTLFIMFFGALGAGYIPYFMKIEGHDHHHHDDHDHHAHDDDNDAPPAGLTGIALVAGFLGMLFLDQLQAAADGGCHHHHHHHIGHTHSSDHTEHHHSSGESDHIVNFIREEHENPLSGREFSTGYEPSTTKANDGPKEPSTTTSSINGGASAERAVVGLLVHCASDGLALGSAFLSGNSALSFVVGVAMVLHKAPMAFGLTSYLQSQRWPWVKAQRTLVIFAATAPSASLFTYTILRAVPSFTTPTAVALAILFSGGTLLHATMHILQDLVASSGHLNKEQLIAVAVGSLLPAVLSWGHHH